MSTWKMFFNGRRCCFLIIRAHVYLGLLVFVHLVVTGSPPKQYLTDIRLHVTANCENNISFQSFRIYEDELKTEEKRRTKGKANKAGNGKCILISTVENPTPRSSIYFLVILWSRTRRSKTVPTILPNPSSTALRNTITSPAVLVVVGNNRICICMYCFDCQYRVCRGLSDKADLINCTIN